MNKKSVLGLLAFCMTSLVGGVASAQSFPFQGIAKDKFSACAKSIASGGGSTYAIGCSGTAEGTVWKRDPATGWSQFSSMGFKQISVSGAGVPWALKANGTIWKFSFIVGWEQKGQAGACAREIAAGATDNDVWAVGCGAGADSGLWRFNGSVFTQPQAGAAAAHVAIGSNSSTPFALTSLGGVWKWNGSAFAALSGCATAIGGNGWAVGCNRTSIWLYNSGNQPTLRANAPALMKEIGSSGLTGVDDSGNVYLQSTLTSFAATGFQIPEYTIRFKGTGFTANKNISVFYQHATTGAWLTVGAPFAQTKADGTIDYTQSAVSSSSCSGLQMHNDPNVFRNMQLRMDIADGSTTYFSSPAIFDACQPFLPN
jgi:hypothetical protein